MFSRPSEWKDRSIVHCRGFGVRYTTALVQVVNLVSSTCDVCLCCRVYLTSTGVDNRCQGTRLLSEVLTHLHSHTLPQDDREFHNRLTNSSLVNEHDYLTAVHYLALFYCDRLKDRVAVIPYVLRGLHAMVNTWSTHHSYSSLHKEFY